LTGRIAPEFARKGEKEEGNRQKPMFYPLCGGFVQNFSKKNISQISHRKHFDD
jgi:hypothetical protein